MENKKLHVKYLDTSQEFVKFINDNGILREDILMTEKQPSLYTLYYYK